MKTDFTYLNSSSYVLVLEFFRGADYEDENEDDED